MGSHASQDSRPEVAVVYLARKTEGIAAFQAFALMSWGKNNISLPRDFPEVGVKFQADRNAMQTFLHQLTPRAPVQDHLSYTLSAEEPFL